jgi:hypothetical protein
MSANLFETGLRFKLCPSRSGVDSTRPGLGFPASSYDLTRTSYVDFDVVGSIVVTDIMKEFVPVLLSIVPIGFLYPRIESQESHRRIAKILASDSWLLYYYSPSIFYSARLLSSFNPFLLERPLEIPPSPCFVRNDLATLPIPE